MIMRQGIKENRKNNKIIMNNIFANQHEYSFPYFAGWADGDGCFKNVESKKTSDSYTLLIVNEEPVYQLSNLYQTSVVLGTPEKREWINASDIRKETALCGQRLIHFCQKVAPFLIDKQNKALKILKKRGVENYSCSYKKHNKEQFIEYLAGFLEAEGCFIYKLKITQYGVRVSNYNKNILEFIKDNLKKHFDIDVNIHQYKNAKLKVGPNGKTGEKYFPKQKYIYVIAMGGQKGMPVFKEILPYMTIDYKIDAVKKIINHDYSRKKK